MKKAIIFITLSFLLFVPLYAISFTYFDTPQSYDSNVLLSSFEQNKDFLTKTEEEIKLPEKEATPKPAETAAPVTSKVVVGYYQTKEQAEVAKGDRYGKYWFSKSSR